MSDSIRSDGLLPLTLSTSWPEPDVCVVHLAGELDIATVPVVADYLREQAAAAPAELVLDLSAVSLLAATGVGLIMTAERRDDGIDGRLHLVGVVGNRAVERVLALTGVAGRLSIHHSCDALLAHLGRR
jgi:anti-anti-sigma factor